jgi:hypothetical protein
MGRINMRILCFFLSALVANAATVALTPAVAVRADTNGFIATPTNFFAANSNLIAASLASSVGVYIVATNGTGTNITFRPATGGSVAATFVSSSGSNIYLTLPNLHLRSNSIAFGNGGQNLSLTGTNPDDPLSFEADGSMNGKFNTFFGIDAGLDEVTGNLNTFIGAGAGKHDVNGTQNTFVGMFAGEENVNGYHNTYIGVGAGQVSTNGIYNVYVGTDSGLQNLRGSGNVFFGTSAGSSTTNSSNSVFIGRSAGATLTKGNGSVIVGGNAAALAAIVDSSVIFGDYSAAIPTNITKSTLVGSYSGAYASNILNSQLNGYGSAQLATNIEYSSVQGNGAAQYAHKISTSSVLGNEAAQFVTNIVFSDIIGHQAATYAKDIQASFLAGYYVARNATNLAQSVVAGYRAGEYASGAEGLIAFGREAGNNATNTANVILLGRRSDSYKGITNAGALGVDAWVAKNDSFNVAMSLGINESSPLAPLHVSGSAIVSNQFWAGNVVSSNNVVAGWQGALYGNGQYLTGVVASGSTEYIAAGSGVTVTTNGSLYTIASASSTDNTNHASIARTNLNNYFTGSNYWTGNGTFSGSNYFAGDVTFADLTVTNLLNAAGFSYADTNWVVTNAWSRQNATNAAIAVVSSNAWVFQRGTDNTTNWSGWNTNDVSAFYTNAALGAALNATSKLRTDLTWIHQRGTVNGTNWSLMATGILQNPNTLLQGAQQLKVPRVASGDATWEWADLPTGNVNQTNNALYLWATVTTNTIQDRITSVTNLTALARTNIDNQFTGANTFSGNNTFSGSNYVSGANTWRTNAVTLGTGYTPTVDFSKPYAFYTTNDVFTFNAPIGTNVSALSWCSIFVTNSSGSLKAVTAPIHTFKQGTWNVTNVSVFSFTTYGNAFTNAIALPLW